MSDTETTEITAITVFNNGPLGVRGDNIVLKDADGNDFNLEGKTAIALCRCGNSNNKPFCDGSHAASGFESEIKAT